MKTYSKILPTLLLLILVVPPVDADEPPENGKHVTYYENGQKAWENHYKNGMKEGLGTAWHDNGQKAGEILWKTDELVSASVWKPDGTPCPITKIVNGSGIVVSWHENGKKESERHYKNSELVSVSFWKLNGEIKEEQGFIEEIEYEDSSL